MIVLDDLTVRIGRRTILPSISLTFEPARLTAIIGPNGSGKTTLIRAISGALPASGSITLDGRGVAGIPSFELALRRAVLEQSTELAFPFTVREVVGLGIVDRSAADAGERPERALEVVDLAGFGERMYQELSSGEKQRVQLARALCQVWTPVTGGAPCWLLLDEPVASLDIKHQLVVMRIARAFACAGGGAIAVLHDLNLAAAFADRIVAMHAGRVAASGTPTQTLVAPVLGRIFECEVPVGRVPADGAPFVLPHVIT